jgi:hypothetical protein
MDKSDWLLLAIGEKMEPIQVQKAMFKFGKESHVPEAEAYQFEPYNWGPCSFEIYDDLRSLRGQKKIDCVPTGSGWNLYRLTELGHQEADKIRAIADKDLLNQLDEKRTWVVSRTFSKLLQDVYQQYPDYATESIFVDRGK